MKKRTMYDWLNQNKGESDEAYAIVAPFNEKLIWIQKRHDDFDAVNCNQLYYTLSDSICSIRREILSERIKCADTMVAAIRRFDNVLDRVKSGEIRELDPEDERPDDYSYECVEAYEHLVNWNS